VNGYGCHAGGLSFLPMPALIIHDIAFVAPSDCQLTIESGGEKHELFARRVGDHFVGSHPLRGVGSFEPLPLFTDLSLSAFQTQQLVSFCCKLVDGGRLQFPLYVPETRHDI